MPGITWEITKHKEHTTMSIIVYIVIGIVALLMLGAAVAPLLDTK